MNNYYEILEVSENASPEVIEKAYKALVKKYHPDLQPNEKKAEAENKIKIINEAYEILSDKNKKEKYDTELKMQKIKEEQLKYNQMNKSHQNNTDKKNINNSYSQNSIKKRPIKKPQSHKTQDYENCNLQNEYNRVINEAYNNAYQNAYNQAYINSLKNMGYEIKYERPFKYKIKTFFATILGIILFIIICFILWQIPPIKNYFIDLYYSNDAFKIVVDIISNIVKSFISLFSNQ